MSMTDQQRLHLILQIGHDLLNYLQSEGIDKEVILKSQVIQWTITTPLYNIGEQVYYLSHEFKERHTDMPWFRISGMRHRLVHSYQDTNWSIVADAVLRDIPIFIEQVEQLNMS